MNTLFVCTLASHGWSILYTNCAIYCPSQSSRERKKGRRKCVIFYLCDCTRRTRSRNLNPEIQSRRTRRKRLPASFRARARQTNDIDYYYYVHAVVVFATRGLKYPDLTDEIFQNHSLHASTTTLPSYALTTRIYTHVHLHAHTRAIRCRSEMFDLLHTFLAQRQKKGLVSTDFQLCLQEEGIFGSLLHYVDYMEKWELYIQTVFVFYSSRKDKLS